MLANQPTGARALEDVENLVFDGLIAFPSADSLFPGLAKENARGVAIPPIEQGRKALSGRVADLMENPRVANAYLGRSEEVVPDA